MVSIMARVSWEKFEDSGPSLGLAARFCHVYGIFHGWYFGLIDC